MRFSLNWVPIASLCTSPSFKISSFHYRCLLCQLHILPSSTIPISLITTSIQTPPSHCTALSISLESWAAVTTGAGAGPGQHGTHCNTCLPPRPCAKWNVSLSWFMYFAVTWLLCLRRGDPLLLRLRKSVAGAFVLGLRVQRFALVSVSSDRACRISFGWFKCVITTIARRCHCLFTQPPSLSTPTACLRPSAIGNFIEHFRSRQCWLRPRLPQFTGFFAIFMAVWVGCAFFCAALCTYTHVHVLPEHLPRVIAFRDELS